MKKTVHTLKEAKEIGLKLWAELERTGSLDKTEAINYFGLPRMRAHCPFCELFYNARDCTLKESVAL
jgi:hypothetical protein